MEDYYIVISALSNLGGHLIGFKLSSTLSYGKISTHLRKYTVFRKNTTFSFISQRVICGFKQKLQ